MRRTSWSVAVAGTVGLLATGCIAQDPIAEDMAESEQSVLNNCYTNGQTIDVVILPNGKWVELRWSEPCQTNWARSGSPSPTNHKVYIKTNWGDYDEQPGWGTGFYTDAAVCPSPCKAQACEWAEGSQPYCTAWL